MRKSTILPLLLVASTLGLSACFLLPASMRSKADNAKAKADDAKSKGQEAEEVKKQADDCNKLAKQLPAIEEENALGQAIALNWIKNNGGLVIDKSGDGDANKLERYVNQVGKNLAATSSRPGIEWTFGVLNSDSFNAFSAPGGYVFVTKGLLKQVTDEAQLAGVLSHEIAHVTKRHALRVYAQEKANQCRTSILAQKGAEKAAPEINEELNAWKSALGAPGGYIDFSKGAGAILGKLTDKVVGTITEKGFAHGDEFDADKTAGEMLLTAGYDAKDYQSFLAKIPQDGSAFANHPKNAERQQKLDEFFNSFKTNPDPFLPAPDSKDLKPVVLKDELAFAKK